MKNYTAVVERDPVTKLLVGYVPGFPGAHSQAESLDELQANLREVIEMLLEDGEPKLEAEFVGTQSIAVFDIDGDGWNDLIIGRCNSTEVWRNTTPIAGDVNVDHRVNVADLLLIINSWGACPAGPPTSCPADLNHDGQVNVLDLLEVIGHWG